MKTMNTPTLRFKEFSGAWEIKTVNDLTVRIIDGDRGVNYPNGDDFSDDGYCLFLNAKNVTKSGFAFDELSFISKEKDEQLRKGKLIKNDLIITTRGTVGNIAYFDNNVKYENIRINSGMVIVRNESNDISSNYLYQYFYSPNIKKTIDEVSFGSAQPQLTVGVINKIKIGIPTLPEQNKIANFLTAIDEKIAQLSQTAQLLTDYKKGVMQQIFSQQLRFKDDDGREFAEWERITFSDFVTERSEISNDDSLPTYSLTIEKGVTPKTERYEREHLVGDTDNAYKLVKQHDFAYNPMNLRFGAIAKYTGEGSVKVSKYYNIFYVKNTADATFFEAFIKSPDMLKFYDKMSTGSLIEKKRVHFTDFLKFKFNLPSLPEQTKIANFLTAIDDKINHNQTQLDAMKQYKSGLLQQMFV
ncbi:MAG: restriction endonuclease subunit S [Methylococcaceae bacterium]